MKEAYWGYWLITLGVFVLVVMMFTQASTTSNTQDYLQLKEVTEASLRDAVDLGYYRNYGELKINKEVFIESFLKRFSETVGLNNTYEVNFYDLYEVPPKVSVEVKSKGSSFLIAGTDNTAQSVNRIDAVLEWELRGGTSTSTTEYCCSYDSLEACNYKIENKY